jgi:mRNA interferase MazF
MARRIERGDLWLVELPPPDKRRPVLVLSRTALLRVLSTVTVAAVTSTRHGSPTEVDVGVEEGLKQPSCVDLANVFTVRQAALQRHVGTLSADKMRLVCNALAIAVDCER